MYGGYRIKTTQWCHVELHLQIFNWRLVAVELGDHRYPANLRGWCYPHNQFLIAVIQACNWDGRPDTEPSGWVRAIDTMAVRSRPDYVERHNGEPLAGVTQM